ncbi:MAG: hypothetical protein P4L03_06640 [Terracidiphilus sp.]|nr:hypothetical protein [Terracidiphilus sp.]
MHLNLKSILFACALLALVLPAHAREKKLTKAQLPPAVAKTADQQSSGATVKAYSEDRENGTLEYEVEMVADGHSRDVTIAPDGTLLEVEEEVQLATLPADVQAALKNKAGKAAIVKIESISKKGRLVAYEAQLRLGGKHSEIQVGPNGQTLNHEE